MCAYQGQQSTPKAQNMLLSFLSGKNGLRTYAKCLLPCYLFRILKFSQMSLYMKFFCVYVCVCCAAHSEEYMTQTTAPYNLPAGDIIFYMQNTYVRCTLRCALRKKRFDGEVNWIEQTHNTQRQWWKQNLVVGIINICMGINREKCPRLGRFLLTYS